MKAATMFSGIGAPEVAMPGWDWRWASEIEPFPSAVFRARYPGTPNLGDVTDAGFAERAKWRGRLDVLVFGAPCQSFSVAGRQGGIADPRGQLSFLAFDLVGVLRPRWFVFENVANLLAIDGGRVFGALLRKVEKLGYGWAYRTLDAQYFGVPQRRRRVFVVGYLGGWRPAAAVLFERHSLQGHHPPSRDAWAGAPAGTLGGASARGGWRFGSDEAAAGQLIANPLRAQAQSSHREDSDTFVTVPVGVDFRNGVVQGEIVGTLEAAQDRLERSINDVRTSIGIGQASDPMFTLVADRSHGATAPVTHTLRAEGFDASEGGMGRGQPMVNYAMDVRRLTPRECERLQGFPDDYTLIPWRRHPAAECPDGPRYKALGNSMAVPVMRWLLGRIERVRELMMEMMS